VRGRGLVLLVALAAIMVPAPTHAVALDSDLKHSAAFKLQGSNGYSIIVIAASERADGRGDVFLIVHRRDSFATYVAAAMLTGTRVEADLGRLGTISLDVVPSSVKRTLHRRCGDEPETFTFEPQSYRGTFEFHGEEGYTEAITSAPREYTRFFFDLLCGGVLRGESSGPGLPGARLGLSSRSGPARLGLRANKNRPRARSRFEVEIHEKRNGIAISRGTTLWAGAAAFDYDPLLRTATLDPPAPFSGRATFRRGAAPANRWSGNLTVDLPGRSDVPLTGSGVRATLASACRQGEGAGSRADCGF
jgi:hypothetical protein